MKKSFSLCSRTYACYASCALFRLRCYDDHHFVSISLDRRIFPSVTQFKTPCILCCSVLRTFLATLFPYAVSSSDCGKLPSVVVFRLALILKNELGATAVSKVFGLQLRNKKVNLIKINQSILLEVFYFLSPMVMLHAFCSFFANRSKYLYKPGLLNTRYASLNQAYMKLNI